MASSTLQTIRNKVRRITRSPSLAQLSNADLDQYINTFIENDIPTSMKLFSLRTVLTFYTQPGQDVYETITDPALDTHPLFNFRNRYTAVHEPVYIAGVAAFYTQERDIFFGNWPQTNTVQQTQFFGDGTTGPFVGILGSPQLQNPPPFVNAYFIQKNSVMMTMLDTNFEAMQLVDYPVNNQLGALGLPNEPQTIPSPYGQINYKTGQYMVNFPNPTLVSSTVNPNPLWGQYINFAPGLPTSMLFYDNKFTLRPVPDKSYIVQVEANIIPTELLTITDVPQITQWWQWIAFGASKKIFEERMDFNSVNMIMPSLKEQESMVLSTAMEVYANQRTTTIYSNNGGIWPTGWNNQGGWPFN